MALIKCADCGKECSDSAVSCPNCGKPISELSYLTKNLGFGGFIYTLLIIVGICFLAISPAVGIVLIIIGVIFICARLQIWTGTGRK